MYRALVLLLIIGGLYNAPTCYAAPEELASIYAAATIDGQEYLGIVDLTGPLKLRLDWDPVVRRVELTTNNGIRISTLVNFDFADVGGVPLHLPDKVLNQHGRILISRRSLIRIFDFLESSGQQPVTAPIPPIDGTAVDPGQPAIDLPSGQTSVAPATPTPAMVISETTEASLEESPAADTPTDTPLADQPPESIALVPEPVPGLIAQATFAVDILIPEALPLEQRIDLQAAFAWLAERLREHLAAYSIAVWMPPPGTTPGSKDFGARQAGVNAWLDLSAASSAAATSAIGYVVFLQPTDTASELDERLANALVTGLQKAFPEAAIPGPRRSRLQMLESVSAPAVMLEIDLPATWRFAGSPISRGYLNRLAAVCGETLSTYSREQGHE